AEPARQRRGALHGRPTAQRGAAGQPRLERPARRHRHHGQHRARERAIDRLGRAARRAAGGIDGRRGVHVLVPRPLDPVRAGPRRVEHCPETPARRLEDPGGDRRAWRRRVRYPRHVMKLTIGSSPCPNDCFIFDAIVNRRIDLEGLEFAIHMADVEALNKAAFAGEAAITKLSYHAYAYCADRYVALDARSALGRNCGPLLISLREISQEEVAAGGLRIAIPGTYTTANLLLGLAFPRAQNKTELVFSEIEPALLAGRFDAGLIIHENR